MAVYFVFIDGIGVGKADGDNPYYCHKFPFFERAAGSTAMTLSTNPILKKDHVYKPVDATLGVEGLPQSGTGQVSLFAGVNAPKHVGKHYGPYPHSSTKEMLSETSIASRASRKGLSFTFMNAYPPIFFRISSQRDRWSTTTLMCRQASLPLHTVEDVHSGKGITAEITQEIWKERLGIELPSISEAVAAERMLKAGRANDIVMYEYYLTDKAGHAMDHNMAENVIARIDRFLTGIADGMRAEDMLLVCSDHGNVEDLGVKTHTLNPVPLIVLGNGADAFYGTLSIDEVVPNIMKRFD
jgi:hypothetical protein